MRRNARTCLPARPAASAQRAQTKNAPAGAFSSPSPRAAAHYWGTVSTNGWRCASFAKCLSRFGWRSRQLISGIRKSR
ncbi:hypothetical protein Y027_5483 [Burkholderia pseudomallei TSV5]|nr:hypothetical protein Y027_5483 [Burkholderia pseudomallei TSV5]KGX50603.1 hypothetical protein Y025_5357 [Burkholderia pseudomallei TSV32]KGX68122.1 hypothetical protein Y026_5449 [Burkholderia pseudomallei TSV28]KOS75750.1 putative transposase [Burkholderia mallei]KOT08259.1 putative transposase [Burkholderia mallei]